ncbi:hypothetical protein AB0M68_03580 [Streptomyces sp. NPDC051453]|uniref:hypothetical protein n=1 Tax=Streptomyces sp. NPDC051453 TaxID=3154941 RepID=UPI00343FB6E4
MRVKTREAFSPYYNYGLVPLGKGEEVSGALALFLLETGSPVDPVDDDAKAWRPPGREEPELEVPAELDIDANAADVLAWVGDDPERAAEALAAEQAKDKPRSTLVKQLEKLAASDPDE